MIVRTLLAAGSVLGLGVLASGGKPWPEDAAQRPRDRDAIRAHIERVVEAYRRKDRAQVRATHAPQWRGFITRSRSVVRGIEEYMLDAEGLLTSAATFRDWEFQDFDVLFYGELAVVSYVANLRWHVDGVTLPDKLRVLDVYARQHGEWNQVASHVAPHPEALEAYRQQGRTLTPTERSDLLAAREAVWRAWFAGDEAALGRALPQETVAINAAGQEWHGLPSILAASKAFAASGGRLVSLAFPRTEIQVFGDVAVLYTSYRTEVDGPAGHSVQAGRGTEVFVRRDGRWVNPGWHLDSGQ